MLRRILLASLVLLSHISWGNNVMLSKDLVTKDNISGKWDIAGESEFKSIEFNECGNYIISIKIIQQQFVLFGTYEILNNNTIDLSDFGTLIINKFEGNSVDFTMKKHRGATRVHELFATKNEHVISNTIKTDLLCRTWKMLKKNGKNVLGTTDEVTLLFSKTGTYFLNSAHPAETLGHWKWQDDLETKILYAYKQFSDWSNEDEIEIIELSNTVLKIQVHIKGNQKTIYTLIPLVCAK